MGEKSNPRKGAKGKALANRTHEKPYIQPIKVFPKLTVQNAFAINCAITLGVLKALHEFADLDLSLKWPNDILSRVKVK